MLPRPHATLILATSADGKIADDRRRRETLGSRRDFAHLQEQIALADGIIFGAQTLRTWRLSLTVSDPQLLSDRAARGQSSQPVHIVCTRSGDLDENMKFFRQPIDRWLLTTETGAKSWQGRSHFDRIITPETPTGAIDFPAAFAQLAQLGIDRLAVTGGGTLAATLFRVGLIDEVWLTLCPLIVGGTNAPTAVDGVSFDGDLRPQLDVLQLFSVGNEIFIRYRVRKT